MGRCEAMNKHFSSIAGSACCFTAYGLQFSSEMQLSEPIPADAEIVIAGWSPPDKVRFDEGPFGEWTGYYASREQPTPIVEVERIYHRHDPIILGAPPSRPPGSNTYFRSFIRSALLYNQQGVKKCAYQGFRAF